jgi:hypothetical protein
VYNEVSGSVFLLLKTCVCSNSLKNLVPFPFDSVPFVGLTEEHVELKKVGLGIFSSN